MPGLWEGHEFTNSELEFWAHEISAAAQELPEGECQAFLARACEGSQPLRRQVATLLSDAWTLAPAAPFVGVCRPGDVIRDCLILGPVGRGAAGEVYKGIQRSLRRMVAVKVVTGGADASNALAIEAANTARLLHPNVATVYDADPHGTTPCIVMEYVDAMSLRVWLERHREARADPTAAALTQTIVRQVAMALGEAHRQGILHRDVKPENILVRKHGGDYTVKVVDFGIAQRIRGPQGFIAGTPGYIAPEQLNQTSSDGRADIFSLGVVLFELLTGRHPFKGGSDAETYLNTLRVEPEFPSDPSGARLADIARRALQKSPENRYRTIDALIADLEAWRPTDRDIGFNPLLSEFPLVLQRWWQRHSSGFLVALVSFAWGCASLVMSALSGSACLRVQWTAAGVGAYEMTYGYAVEPNAGLWYLAGSSLCFLTVSAFLEAAHRGLARAPLVSVVEDASSGGNDPVARIASHNRRYFKYITPIVAVIGVCFVAVPELLFRGNHAFGWVQADTAGRYLSSTYSELRHTGKIGELAPVERLCDGCSVVVSAVANRSGRFERPPSTLFGAFLVSALVHQMVFAGFLLWTGAKMLFFFGLLSTALLGGTKHGLRLLPDFQDRDDYRFGLGQLDSVYYAMLGLVAVGAIGLFLQAAGNVSKGTYFLAGDPAPALFGQAVLLLATVGLLAILLATPASVFLFLTIKAVNEELGRLSGVRRHLERQLAAARSADEREQLGLDLESVRVQRDVVKQQSLIPIRQPAFVALLTSTCLLLLVLPFAIRWLGSTDPVARGRGTIRDTVCAVSGNAKP